MLAFRYEFADELADGEGEGGFNLPEVGAASTNREHHIYLNHIATITPKLVSQFFLRGGRHDGLNRSRLPRAPKIVVVDAFTGGGAQADRRSTENHFEFSEVLFWSRGGHSVKAGIIADDVSRRGQNDHTNRDGTFYFSSLDDYANGRPFSFSLQRGEGHLAIWQTELAAFIQDDVRPRPNLSVGLGLRWDYENFTPGYNNFSPRVSLAFSPGKSRKTVLRAGAGYFFDRAGWRSGADTVKFDGRRLRQITISNPGYPDPLSGGGGSSVLPSNIVRFAGDLRAAYILNYNFGIERQLRPRTTLSVNYTAARGVKVFRSRDINAPLPPLYERPDPSIAILHQLESSGNMKSHALELALRGNATRLFSGMVRYRLGRAYNDTGGIRSLPANSLDLSGEWSRAGFDERHRFDVVGALKPGKLFNLGVVLRLRTGRPYDLTTGRDDNRDSLATDRPPGVPRNSLRGPGSATLDLRWSKKFLLDRKKQEEGPTATLGVDAFNVLNRVNVRRVVGNQSSPFFGRPVASGPARRIQLFFRFEF
ncbi:MAG: TonB-dependent receptor [bacterium]|nr:TonB-dependent receptor [bacterium]